MFWVYRGQGDKFTPTLAVELESVSIALRIHEEAYTGNVESWEVGEHGDIDDGLKRVDSLRRRYPWLNMYHLERQHYVIQEEATA